MNIVVGYIHTPEGEAAVEGGIREAQPRGGTVVVVPSLVGGDHEDVEEYRESAEAMERIRQRLHDEGIDHCTHEYVRGQRPVDDLLEAVESHDAGMIVIGIRSRSTTGKLLLGSNALEILHDSSVPVMCVKADED